MPLARLTTLDGRELPIREIDITTTVQDFGLPPADVAAVVNDALNGRRDVGRDQITASQSGNGARQLYLEEVIDYSREPKRQMAALKGTMTHSLVNIEHEGMLAERRLTSKSGKFSMKYDTYVIKTGVLRDAKYPDYFKVKMILRHGIKKEGRDYMFQLNLGALILRQHGYEVNEMWLDFGPTGVGWKEKQELEEKFGITVVKPLWIPVEVPFLPEAEVWDVYERLSREKAEAHKTGVVPAMCTKEQTWNGKKCEGFWCPVAKECAAIAAQRGERHPLNKKAAKESPLELDEALAESLRVTAERPNKRDRVTA